VAEKPKHKKPRNNVEVNSTKTLIMVHIKKKKLYKNIKRVVSSEQMENKARISRGPHQRHQSPSHI